VANWYEVEFINDNGYKAGISGCIDIKMAHWNFDWAKKYHTEKGDTGLLVMRIMELGELKSIYQQVRIPEMV